MQELKDFEPIGDLRFQLNETVTFPFAVPYGDLGLDKYALHRS